MTGIEDKKQVGNAQAISTLNKYFTTSGLSSVSDEEFGKAMQDSAGRQAIYDILVKRGLDVGDYDKFSTDFGFGIVTPEPEEVVVEPVVTSASEQAASQTEQNVTEVTAEPEDVSWRIGASQQLAAMQRGIGAGKQVLSGIKLEAPRNLSGTIVEQQKAMSNPTNVVRYAAITEEEEAPEGETFDAKALEKELQEKNKLGGFSSALYRYDENKEAREAVVDQINSDAEYRRWFKALSPEEQQKHLQQRIEGTNNALEGVSSSIAAMSDPTDQSTSEWVQEGMATYGNVIENGSPEIFRNIADGNIGDMEFAYLDNQRKQILDKLKTEKQKYQERLVIENVAMPASLYLTAGLTSYITDPQTKAIVQYLDDQIAYYENMVTKEDWKRNGHKSGIGKGFKNIDLRDIITLNIGPTIDKGILANIEEKESKGKELTPQETEILGTLKKVNELGYVSQGLGGATSGYAMSTSTAQTLPFMASLAVTGGASSAVGTGVSKWLLGRNAGKFIAGFGKMGGTAATNLVLNPQYTASNYYGGMMDEYTKYGVVQSKPVFQRFMEELGETSAEFLSEASGGIILSGLSKVPPFDGFSRWFRTKFKLTDNEAITRFLDRMEYSGPLKEFEEEIFNNLVSPVFGGKSWNEIQESWEESFSPENLKITAGTVLLTSVAMGAPVVAIQGGSALHWRSKANTALKNIENSSLRQTLYDAVRLETTEDVQRALAAIDWQSQDTSDIQNAAEYVNYHTYAYIAEGAEMSEVAKKEMNGKIAIIEGMAHEGIVRTAEYEGQPVYVTQMDSAGASVIMRMDGTQEQVATSALQKVEDTPVQEIIESIYAQEAPAIEQGLNEISEEGDMAEAEAAGVEYRPSSEVQREFDEREGREAPASGFQSGEVVSVDGKEGEIVSVDPYTRTARVEIDGVPTRVSFDQMSRVGQESEVSEETTPQEQADVQERQYKVGEIITFRQPIFQEDGSVVEGDYIDAEVISVEANADGGYNVILRKQNGGQYGFNTAYGHPTIKEAEAQEQTSIAEEATTSIAEEAATPVAIQPITNEAGELDIRAMGEEQTAQYVTESGDTDYVESMLADRRKKLEKLQKNDKLPLNLAERQKAIAERNAEKTRLEEEISMWEGVQNRLSQPQQTAEVESVATPEVAPVKSVEQQAAQVAEAPTEVATAEAQQEVTPEQATQAEVQPQTPTATTATTASTTATTNPHTQEQVEGMSFEVGVVMNDAARAMKPTSLDWLNKVAQALGVRIAFVDDVEGGLANGLYNRDTEKPTIYIAANRTAGEKFVIGHEMLHRMAQVAPDAYKSYKEFVLEELGGQEVSRRKKRITDHYKKYEMPVPSAETLAEEVVADFTGDIISAKGQVFEGFAKKIARKDTKLLRAFRNAVEHIRSFFKKGDAWEQNLTRRLKELDKLLAESVKAVEGSKPKAKRVRQSNFAENTRNAYRKEITAMFGGEYPNIEAEMLADIATGRVKFIRKNDGNKRGLESFFGNRPKELNSRIGITAKAENGGYSLDGYVHEFAQSPHHFWGNKTASEVDFDDSLIRDALESVLLTTSSPTNAMKQLREMHKTQNENPYEDEGYIESLLEDEQMQNQEYWDAYFATLPMVDRAQIYEVFAEAYFDDIENNNNFAQNRQQYDERRIVGENNAQREIRQSGDPSGSRMGYGYLSSDSGNEAESEGGQADNGASTLRGARADRGDGERPELSVRLQQRRRVEQQAAQDIDSRIEQQQNKVRQLQNTYTQKKREIGEAYSQDNQGTLFEETTAPTDSLFEVERDFSQNNLNNILRPIQEELNAEIAELEALKSSREQFIADAVAAYDAQLEIGDGNTPSLYSLRGSAKSLVGIHNISLEKLQKAIKMGGLANPSVAVLDVDKTTHDDYGDISLILSSNMVDSRLGRNAGTWAGDAWTPTYPQVVKRINKKEDVSRFYRDINKMPEEMRNKVALDWNSFLEGRSAASMAYWFLFEKGEAPEMLTIPSRYPEDIVEQVRNETNGSFSLYGLSPEERMAVVDIYIAQEYNGDRTAYEKALQDKVDKIKSRGLTHRSALVRKSAEQNLADINEYGFDYNQIADFVRDVERDYNHRGTVDVDGTIRSAQDYIKENGLQEEFDAWKSDLENRYDIREFIFNGYSNSGEKKWLPHTVENASRWMKKQGREGSVATFPSFGVFVAVAIPRMTSLASIRKRKSQLGKTEQEFNEFKDRWEQVYYELGQKLQPDANSFEDYGWWRLIEAVGQKNPREFIRRQYGIELSNSDVQQFNKLINAIRTNYPARYFETKFERPVQLSEFTAAVVPESTPEEVKTTLREEGLNVYEYDENVEGSRREATLDATDSISIRFSLRNTDTFYSNAEYAVRGIKQEKATPEQWLKMIEKAGGLKAGEDKWLGLSDWLKDKMRATPKEKPTTVTISGVEYNVKELEETILSEVKTILSENGFEDEIVGIRLVGSYVRGEQGSDSDIDVIVEYKGDSSEDGLFNVLNDEENRIRIEGVEVDINPITEGKSGTLDEWERRNSGFTKKPNTLTKQEVLDYINANKIVVEDVEYGDIENTARFKELQEEFRQLYYENDYNGERAMEAMVDKYGDDFNIAFTHAGDDLIVEDTFGTDAAEAFIGTNSINETRRQYTTDGLENKREIALVVPTIEPWEADDNIHFGDAGEGRAVAWVRFGETTDEAGNRVLVIDEIQSNRHQEGREKGYISDEVIEAQRQRDYLYNKMYKEGLTEEERNRYYFLGEFIKDNFGIVPSAPFEKNWHEVAMKRILRYAAENGYDKVAWTTGDQQGERYNITKTISKIEKESKNRTECYVDLFESETGGVISFTVDKSSGEIIEQHRGRGFEGRNLSDVLGKSLAHEILSSRKRVFEQDNLRIGGEGMRAFYDQILPNFMNKYGKKWGVKVGEVTMPNLAENNTMHSVDITPAMRESVMQGQPLFSLRQPTAEEMADIKAEREAIEREAKANGTWLKAPNGQPTNLTPEQWVNVRTSRFKEWFGDWENDPENASKVVDANGEPMVMFHGSNWRPFLEGDGKAVFRMEEGAFGEGAYFTSAFAEAADYVRDKLDDWELTEDEIDDAGYVTEVFLNIRDAAKVILDGAYGGDSVIAVATSPEQIKSATDNAGTYSSENPDIRHSLRNMVPTNEPVTFDNFYNSTAGVWEVLPISEAPTREPDYVSQRWDGFGVSSRYWYGEDEGGEYVIRESDHWSRAIKGDVSAEDFKRNPYGKYASTPIASCRWALDYRNVATDEYVDKKGVSYGKIYLQDLTHYEDTYARHSLRLPQYTDAFAALKEEYNALDKNNAKALADFRARKRNLVEEYWKDFSRAVGSDLSVVVIDTTNNPNSFRPVYGRIRAYAILNGMQLDEIPSYEETWEDIKEGFEKGGIALYLEEIESIFSDVTYLDKVNTRKEATQMFLHEYIHSIIKHNINRRDLARMWPEVAKTKLGKKVLEGYKGYGSAKLSGELLAYTIAGVADTDIRTLLDYIEGDKGVMVEDVVKTFEKSLPLRDSIAKQILNIIQDGYKNKEREGNSISPDAGSKVDNRGRVQEKAGDIRSYGGVETEGSSAERERSTSGRGEDVAEEEYDIYEVSGYPEGTAPVYSLREIPEAELKARLEHEMSFLEKARDEFHLAFQDTMYEIRKLQEALEKNGVKIYSDNDFYALENAAASRADVGIERYYQQYITPLQEFFGELAKKYGMDYGDITDYLLAKHSLERHASGLNALNPDPNHIWSEQNVRDIIDSFEAKVAQADIDNLWKRVNEVNDRNLEILVEGGVKSRADIQLVKSHNWQYYVPLMDWDEEANGLTDPAEQFDVMVNYRNGSTKGRWFQPKAKGRTTKPSEPLANMIIMGTRAIIAAENNKAKVALYNLLHDANQKLGNKVSGAWTFSERYYVKTRAGWTEVKGSDLSAEDIADAKAQKKEIDNLKRERKAAYINATKLDKAGRMADALLERQRGDALGVDIKDKEDSLDISVDRPKDYFKNEVKNPFYDKEREVVVYINGVAHTISFKNARFAQAVNKANKLRLENVAYIRHIWKGYKALTRVMSKVSTTLNPAFALVTNPLRDFAQASFMHTTDAHNGHYRDFNKMTFSHGAEIWRGLRGKANPLSEAELSGHNIFNRHDRNHLIQLYGKERVNDTLFQKYQELGGQTGFAYMQDIDAVRRRIRRNVKRVQKGKSLNSNGVLRDTFQFYDDVAKLLEVKTRYSTFLAALENGDSVVKAIDAARNITVNFGRQGYLTPLLSGLYVFFNPYVQGTAQFFKVAKKNWKRATKLMVGLAVMGYLMSALSDWWWGYDDGDDDELTNIRVSDWLRRGYFAFPVPFVNRNKGAVMRFPMPQIFRIPFGIGATLYDYLNGYVDGREAGKAIVGIVLNDLAYGYNEGSRVGRGIIPTVAQPFSDLKANEDVWGRSIYREDKWGIGYPDTELHNKNVNSLIKATTDWLNEATGGDRLKSGWIDWNPSKIQYGLEQAFGGLGGFVRRTGEFFDSLNPDSGVEFELQNIPFLGSLLYTVNPESWYEKYHEYDNIYGTNDEGKNMLDWMNMRIDEGLEDANDPEIQDFLKHASFLDGYYKESLKPLISLRNEFHPDTAEYDIINREINRRRGVVVKVMEETDWDAPKYWESINGVIEKYDPNNKENIDQLFILYGKKE